MPVCSAGDSDEPPNLPCHRPALWILWLGLACRAAGAGAEPLGGGAVLLNRIELVQYLANQSRAGPGAEEQLVAFLQVELRRAGGLAGPTPGPLELGLARGRACRGLAAVLALEPGAWQGEVASLGALLPVEGLVGRAWRTCLREGGGAWRQQRGQLELPWGDDQAAIAGNTVDGSGPGGQQLQRQRRAEEGPEEVTPETRVSALLLTRTTSHNKYLDTGGITVYDNEQFELLLSGVELDSIKAIKFTTVNSTYGSDCHGEGSFHTSDTFTDFQDLASPGLKVVAVPRLQYWSDQRMYYLCVATQDPDSDGTYQFVHQGGEDTSMQIFMDKALLPVWTMICLIAALLVMSGLFSGLNLGLMSLDQTELKIVQATGSDVEKGYATAIMPIRAMGNFLLCSILLGNVLVNNTLTITLDTLTGGGGITAVIGATLGIVVFGEIIPQAICSRHGLAVGARTIWLTKFFMLVTAPLSFPISKVLDLVLGAEVGTVYNKTRLMELLKVTEQYNGLEKDEMNIVTGALVLKQKSVKDVMTNLEDCYTLPLDARLDFDTISEIKEQGYSRIPVTRVGDKTTVVHILFARDLLFVDPDDEKPIEEICKFYKNDVNFVYSDTILTDMFDEFKSGEKGHMAVVQEVNNDGDADPFYETVGLVTLEDIIEEIIQQEIIDETDVVIDNKSKKKRKRERYKKDAEVKMFQGARHAVTITPHENMAVLQFLTTSVRAFSPENMSEMILRKLLSMDVLRELKIQKESREARNNNLEKVDEKSPILMTKGKPCDFFIMIIEGKVEVTIGKEERKFQDGPFSCYGEQMLDQVLLNMIPSSPMVNSGSRGINLSLSMQSTVSQDVRSAPHLKKTNTQLQLNENGGSGRRSTSADCSMQAANSVQSLQRSGWKPDYTLKALTDLVYLKVRRNTYKVANNASRMSKTDSGQMTEHDLSDVLAKVIEADDEFGRTPSIRSPDRWEPGLGRSTTELSQTDFRRESIRSSLSAMKKNLLGGLSRSSVDKSGVVEVVGAQREEALDGMANPAMVGEDIRDEASGSVQSSSNQNTATGGELNNGAPLPIESANRGDTMPSLPALQRDVSGPLQHCRNSIAMAELEGGAGARGRPAEGEARRGESQGASPSDRTSLLHTDQPAS